MMTTSPHVNVQQKNHLVSALSEMYLFMVQVAFLVSKLIAYLFLPPWLEDIHFL